MNVVLVMFRGDGDRRSFSLARDMTVIGRREDCDLRIPVGDVSRKHCRFIREGDTLRLEDLGSSNGTFVNNTRIQDAIVQAGDYVQVGPVQFIVQIDGYPADEDIADPTAVADAESTGEYMALTELPADEPAAEVELEELPATVEDELPELELPEFTPAADAPVAEAEEEAAISLEATPELEVEAEPETEPELSELPTIDEEPVDLPMLNMEADNEPPPPPPPMPSPVLSETQALPVDEIPSPGVVEPVPPVVAEAEDDNEWNFVLEEAEPETAEDVDLDLNAPHEGGHG